MRLTTNELFKTLLSGNDTLPVVRLEGERQTKYQAVLLQIAEDVIRVCEAEGITYHLTGGTALGAVRHEGFIPWDDDMDIDILARDFRRFIRIFRRECGDRYWVHTCDTDNYGEVSAKIRMKGTVSRGREDLETEECGISIDLFRIENVPDNRILRGLHGTACLIAGYLLSCRNFYKNRKWMLKISEVEPKIRKVFRFKIIVGSFLRFLSVKRCAQMTQWWYSRCRNSRSKYVSVPSGINHYFGETYRRSDFVESADGTFEGHSWKLPKETDAYLRHMYGDYMKIPPEEERERHIILEVRLPGEEADVI